MTIQPPQIPLVGGANQQANPWFNVANQFTPRNLHDIIRWARYITVQSPTTTEVVRKLSTYPVTSFQADTLDDKLRSRYQNLLKQLKLKEILQNIGFEFFTIGNVFLSIYFPIYRELCCTSCNTRYSAKKAEWAYFKNYQFQGTCPNCRHQGILRREDSRAVNIKDINIIKWTAEHIVVSHNPITGESEYYYKIPNAIKQKILRGDKLFVNSVPWGFVEAVRHNQDFKFDRDSIFHLKNISSGGTVEGISIPPMLSLFSLVFYQATLRKANEAIATEYLNPMRVIYPQAQTGNSDPVISMSLKNFRKNMEEAITIHKRDKNFFLIAPVPVGYQAVGGEGRNLLVSQEIMQAEEQILLSLGVSRELLSGQTNWESSSVGLRMMENTLYSYVSRLEDCIEWVVEKVTAYLNMETVKVTLAPFKLLDDANVRQLLANLATTGKASITTLFENMDMNYSEEMEKIADEQAALAASQVRARFKIEQSEFLAAQSASNTFKDNEEFKTALEKANSTAEQLYQAEEGVRRSFLSQLKTEDYAQYLMVSKLLDEYKNSMEHEQTIQAGTEEVKGNTESPSGPNPGPTSSGPSDAQEPGV